MQAYYKRFSVIAGFVILLAVVLAAAFSTRRQLAVQVQEQTWTAHTRHVLFAISQTESLLKDAETGQRGYLYTGNPQYLAPYDLAVSQIEPHLQELAQLTADNPRQNARIPELRRLAQEKLRELAQTISLYRTGHPEEAKALVLSDAGQVTMGQLRTLLNEMLQDESSLEVARSATYRRSIRMTVASIYLTSAVAAFGLILLAFYILREMELREKHELQIRQREEWYRVTLTSIGDGVIATDERGRVTFLNPVAERLTGADLAHAKGMPIHDVFPIFNEQTHQPVDNPVRKVMERGKVVGLANHTVLRHRNGSYLPIEDSAAPIRDDHDRLVGVVLVFRDATYERKSQEILRKTEKLAAAARLAATVAHEINNPLEAVGNLIYIAKATSGVPSETLQHLTIAEQELERVSHLTRQTLGFYRESNAPGEVDVPALVESVLRLYSNRFESKNITVLREFGECPSLQGLAGELKQVISNLIANAADAVNQNGTIKVKLACNDAAEGQTIELTIEDDGSGIAAEHQERLFEPFFTTKKDIGTGLGLWVAKEIVVRHGGRIEVRSRDASGTSGAVCTVLLPCDADVQSRAAEAG